MHPKKISIKDYSYFLPEEKIAKYPLPQRDESKLLVYRDGKITGDYYFNLHQHIPSGSMLVFNNTKVVEARILFQKQTGSTIELFCLEPSDEYPDITTAMSQKEEVSWKCLVGGAKKWKEEELVKNLSYGSEELTLSARKIKRTGDDFLIAFRWNRPSMSFAEVLHLAGTIPLPPYLNRVTEESDKERYQTIFAAYEGSVAAPTAGLHFTERIFNQLGLKGIQTDFITLHVGAGTFKPVKSETIEEHDMHAEYFEVRKSFIENLLQHLDRNIVSVGTTSLRSMESLYWLGVKTMLHPEISPRDLHLTQWEAYEIDAGDIPSRQALSSLLSWMNRRKLETLFTRTQIIIAPGYTLKMADALITNFHQPQSTLLLLVAAFTGDDWRRIYEYALANDFRFLSYGDGSLIWKNEKNGLDFQHVTA